VLRIKNECVLTEQMTFYHRDLHIGMYGLRALIGLGGAHPSSGYDPEMHPDCINSLVFVCRLSGGVGGRIRTVRIV